MDPMRLHPAAFASCLLPIVLVACGDSSVSKDPRDQPPLVRTAPVTNASAATRAFTGVVVARTQSDLGFRVPGKRLERMRDTGQTEHLGHQLWRSEPGYP